MKKIFFLLFVVIFSCKYMNNANINNYPELSKIKLRKYIGKEISNFINDIDKQYSDWFFMEEPPGLLSGCTFHFDEYYIQINIILPSNIQNLYSEGKCVLNDIFKEKISRILITSWSGSQDKYFHLSYPEVSTY